MTRAAFPIRNTRRSLADALGAVAAELEAQHTRCKAIDGALGRNVGQGRDQGSDDYTVLQQMDQHTQIIGDLSTFLRVLAAEAATIGDVDIAHAYAAIHLASLRERLERAGETDADPIRHEIEVF